MRRSYDFSKGVRNPYARKLKQPVTILLDSRTVECFRALAERRGMPCQSLINLSLRDCASGGLNSHADAVAGTSTAPSGRT